MGRDQTSTIEVGEFILKIHKDHLGGFEGNQAKDLRKGSYYRGWHYHCEHPRYSQQQIMIILGHELRSMGAEQAPFKRELLALGNIHELNPENVAIWVKIGKNPKKEGEMRSVKSTVLWIGQYGKLHIETNKVRKYVKGIFTKKTLIDALTNFKPICEICNHRYWASNLKECKDCGKWVCRDCRRFYFWWGTIEVKIRGISYKIEDFVYCKHCGKEYECEDCKPFYTKELWQKHLEQLQIKRDMRELPHKKNKYANCLYCGKFVCDLHSILLSGVFEKYGRRVVCLSCLEAQKCIKCKQLIKYREYESAKFNKKYELTCYDCLKKVRHKKADTLDESYKKHANFQSRLKAFFEKIGLEVELERSLKEMYSVDCVCVNRLTKRVYGMEIKTGKISAQITDQLKNYADFFDYFYVIVKEREVERLVKQIDTRFGIFIVDDAETRLILMRVAQLNDLSKDTLVDLMKRYALRWITIEYEFGIRPYKLRMMTRQELRALVKKQLDEGTVREIYCDYVLKKKYVWGFDLTNRDYYKMYPQFIPKAKGSKTIEQFCEKAE